MEKKLHVSAYSGHFQDLFVELYGELNLVKNTTINLFIKRANYLHFYYHMSFLKYFTENTLKTEITPATAGTSTGQ